MLQLPEQTIAVVALVSLVKCNTRQTTTRDAYVGGYMQRLSRSTCLIMSGPIGQPNGNHVFRLDGWGKNKIPKKGINGPIRSLYVSIPIDPTTDLTDREVRSTGWLTQNKIKNGLPTG